MKRLAWRSIGIWSIFALCLIALPRCGPSETDSGEAIDPKKLKVTSVEPSCAEPGETARLEGRGLGAKRLRVFVDGRRADLLLSTGRHVVFVVPEGVSAGPIQVIVVKRVWHRKRRVAKIGWIGCGSGADVTFDIDFQ